jgi:environmental stress-induced protein Ves
MIVRRKEQKTAHWSGGTTTQLLISPSHTTYANFDFDYRMSYATVEVPESTFTFMPGVTRHLMVLKGSLFLQHTDRYEKQLAPFQSYEFNGEWPTTSKGEVMDFNLMVRNGYTGQLMAVRLAPDEKIQIPTADHIGLYAFQTTKVRVLTTNIEPTEMHQGDFTHFETLTAPLQLQNSDTPSLIIVASVQNPEK